jgi:hypothetical protein
MVVAFSLHTFQFADLNVGKKIRDNRITIEFLSSSGDVKHKSLFKEEKEKVIAHIFVQ